MASAASADLVATRTAIEAIAAEDAVLAEAGLDAWTQTRASAEATAAAARRQREGHRLGGIDLADLLATERLARDAALEEVKARVAALAAITRIRIDSHTLWMGEEAEPQ
jgi:hypothetical protein